MNILVHTITADDIGKTRIKDDEYKDIISISSFMGRIQPNDVGKRIYFGNTSGVYSVESDEQFKKRKGK